MAVNKFIGIGNVGRSPEVRFMPDGKCVANISIAITERYKDKQGEQKEVTEWVNIVFFGKLAEVVKEYVTQGQQIYIEGKLKTEKYEKDGVTKYSTKVIAETMKMLGSKGDKPKTAAAAPTEDNKGVNPFGEDCPF